MKFIGCLLMLFIALILGVFVAGFKIIRALFGIKGNPFIIFKTMKDVHRNVRDMQEEMKRQAQGDTRKRASTNEDSGRSQDNYHNETSQQRTDTTSPGARKIIPDDEGEYVSYEEIKENNSSSK